MDPNSIPSQLWLVSFQLMLSAVGWCLAMRLLPEERKALAHWAGFLACLSVGLTLGGLRVTTDERPWLYYNGVNVVTLVGFGLMRRGTERFLRSDCSDRAQAALVLPPLLGLALIPPGLDWSPLRTFAAYAAQALVMLAMAYSVSTPLRQEFGAKAARTLVSPMLLIGLMQLGLAARQLGDMGQANELHHSNAFNQGVLYLYLFGSATFGFGFMHLVTLRLTHQLREASERDALTHLLNRRAMADRMQGAWRRFRRHGTPLALMMVDMDHFKAVNDQHGHAAGDELLKRAAALLAAQLRGEDLIARMGGEEFLVVLPDTDEVAARHLAERLRAVAQEQLPVTLSLGLAMARPDDDTPEVAQHRADAALYRAKAQGRNRVEVA